MVADMAKIAAMQRIERYSGRGGQSWRLPGERLQLQLSYRPDLFRGRRGGLIKVFGTTARACAGFN
jgi:hypothetical protein